MSSPGINGFSGSSSCKSKELFCGILLVKSSQMGEATGGGCKQDTDYLQRCMSICFFTKYFIKLAVMLAQLSNEENNAQPRAIACMPSKDLSRAHMHRHTLSQVTVV